jgi:hypothetical protein
MSIFQIKRESKMSLLCSIFQIIITGGYFRESKEALELAKTNGENSDLWVF